MFTLGYFSLEEIFPNIGKRKVELTIREGWLAGQKFNVNAKSSRLLVLKNDQKCVSCERSGNLFALEANFKSYSNKWEKILIRNLLGSFYNENRRGIKVKSDLQIDFNLNKILSLLERPHLNMYHESESSELILMTKDHIIPTSKGGSDDLTNLQTMCGPCNWNKGNNDK